VDELAPLLGNVLSTGTPPPTIIAQLADLKLEDIDFLMCETGKECKKPELIAASVG